MSLELLGVGLIFVLIMLVQAFVDDRRDRSRCEHERSRYEQQRSTGEHNGMRL